MASKQKKPDKSEETETTELGLPTTATSVAALSAHESAMAVPNLDVRQAAISETRKAAGPELEEGGEEEAALAERSSEDEEDEPETDPD